MAVGFRAEAFRIILLCSLWFTISSTNNVDWEENTNRLPFSCHGGNGSFALHGVIFIANSSRLESSSYAFLTEI